MKSEAQRLKEELLKLKKENTKLATKLDKSKSANSQLKKELKKKDVPKITITEKQNRLASSKLAGIDILNLLSD